MCRKLFFLVFVAVFVLSSFAQAATITYPTGVTKIIWVSGNGNYDAPDAADQGWVDLLRATGYIVDYKGEDMGPERRYWRGGLDAGQIAELQATDLIIFSRDDGSNSYNSSRQIWNEVITTPIMNGYGKQVRRDRLQWFQNNSNTDPSDDMKVIVLDHPIFEGVNIDENDEVDITAFDDSCFTKSKTAGNGTVLAVRGEGKDPYVWIAEWEPGVEFYDGAHTTGGRRLFFSAGTVSGDDGRFNFNEEGAKMWINAVQYLAPPGPPFARNPSPEDDAQEISPDATLYWDPGDGVVSHNVYLGTAPDALVLVDTKPLGDESYKPLNSDILLDIDTTYYWRIDAVNSDVYQGAVWTFKVADHRVVDNFEDYSVTPIEPPEQVETQAGYTVTAEEPPAQICLDPGVIVEPGYTIPGYTIPGYTIPAVAPDVACLLAEWAFEGNYNDTSGSDFHGFPVGNATIVPDADRGGQVLSLDGDLDYVNCGNPPALNFQQGSWAISAWVKNTMTGTGDDNKGSIIANGGDTGGGHRYCLILSEQNEGKVSLVIDDNAGDGIGSSYNKKQIPADTAVNNDVWHHVLGVRGETTITIYIDGVPENSMAIPANYNLIGTVQHDVLIGAITDAPDPCAIYKDYAGLIDDVRIYDCNLSEGNARSLAGVGDLVVDPIEVPPVEVPPVIEGAVYEPMLLHYEFEGSGLDSSGNQHHGTAMQGGSNSRWPTYESGKVGQAAKFYDDGEHFKDDDAGDYMNGLDELTISAWIKSAKTDRDEGWIIGDDYSWSDRRAMRYDRKGGSSRELRDVIKYGVATTEGNEEDESSGEVQTKNWQHVVMTWRSEDLESEGEVGIKLYLDGVLDVPGYDDNAEGGVTDGYTALLIGKGSKDNSSGESWNGLVDDVRIYNTVLSYGQVRYLAGEMDDLDIPPVYGPMIAEYKFDTDASDTSGNNYDGALLGDAAIIDGALSLDGNGDCVDLGHLARLNPRSGPFSISAWVNMSSWGGNWGNVIISKRGENSRGWQLRRRGSSHHLTFTTRTAGNDDPEGSIEPPVGDWYHVAAILDGTGNKTVYIDGQFDRQVGGVSSVQWSGHNAYIGGRANNDNRGRDGAYFNGSLDDVRVYDYALSLAEIVYLAEHEPNPISDIWDTQQTATLSAVGNAVHWGDRAMKVVYPGGSSFARRIIPWWLHGWDAAEASAVTLYFLGDPSNTPKQIRLSLEDYAARESSVAHEDPLAVTVAEWQEWNVAFSDYPGVDVLHIEKFKIHFADAGGYPDGTGTIYFDDIVLHPTRCIPELSLYTDITDDCVVDEKDLRILMGDWLEADAIGTGLIAHYELEGDGTDSSSNGNDGIVRGARVRYDPGIFGTAISLSGSQDVAISGFTQIQGTDALSICMWAKPIYVDGSRYLWYTGETGGHGKLRCFLDDDQWRFREGDGSTNVEIGADATAGEWAHFAAVRQNGDKLYLYIDGLLENETSFGTAGPLASNSNIGSQNGGNFFTGLIDDVRIYKRALDVNDLATVMGGGTLSDVYFPITSPVNFYNEESEGERYVNFKDYTFMADEWLQELLFPPE